MPSLQAIEDLELNECLNPTHLGLGMELSSTLNSLRGFLLELGGKLD
jgi:hypothetical protein